MKTRVMTRPSWTTASLGGPTDRSSQELAGLTEHLRLCSAWSSGLQACRCGADSARSFVAAHLVTSAALLTVVISLTWRVL